MPDPSALYPGPPQQQPSLLNDPARLISTLEGLQRFQILRQQAPALGQIPGQQLQNLQLANTGQQMEQQETAAQTARAYLGTTLLGLDDPTADDVHNSTANFAKAYPLIAAQFPGAINAAADVVLNQPAGKSIKDGANILAATSLSPSSAAGLVQAPPSASGAPQVQPMARALTGGGLQGTSVFPTAPPPGFAERQAGGAALDTKLAGNLADAAEGSPARIGILGNLSDNIDKFAAGPGADWTKVAKSFVNRNVPLPAGWQFDPKSIGAQEEFNKQAMQLAQSQFQTIGGTGTDSKFASAFETSPNDALSALGNKGIIRLLKGNEDALQAKNSAWLQTANANPNASYRQFSQQFNSNFDPRVFQFKYLNPAERQEYFSKLDVQSGEQQKFLRDLAFARKNGWINFNVNQ
jgi:hypothetical protein